MNVYDQAHALMRALKESEEYREYMRLKDAAYEDATNSALLEEYKRLPLRTLLRHRQLFLCHTTSRPA